MPNVMETAAEWLGAELKTHAGSSVTIDYGQERVTTTPDDETLTGWCGRQQYDVMDSEGFATSVMSYDWQFLLADLPEEIVKFSNVRITKGEEIYEAVPIGNRPWNERLDTEGLLLTIHTKQVK